MSFQLRPASKVALKARVALVGPTGSGKTYSALEAALALTGDIAKVAVIDTERGSAALYADEFGEFLHGVIDPPFAPQSYIDALQACADAGAEVVIVDSLSHAWSGQGGVLEIVDDAASRTRGNSFAAWREGTPEQNRLVDTVMRWPGHVIVTMRAKTEYVVEEDARGKSQVRKIGLAPEQRKGIEYEFDLVADIDHEHRLMVSKSRCAPLQDQVEKKPDRSWWVTFAEWLNRGDTVQQQAAGQLDVLGFTADEQAQIVARYQDGAGAAADLTGANAGKLLVHLGDDDAVARMRAAVRPGGQPDPEPDADGVTDVCDICGEPEDGHTHDESSGTQAGAPAAGTESGERDASPSPAADDGTSDTDPSSPEVAAETSGEPPTSQEGETSPSPDPNPCKTCGPEPRTQPCPDCPSDDDPELPWQRADRLEISATDQMAKLKELSTELKATFPARRQYIGTGKCHPGLSAAFVAWLDEIEARLSQQVGA